MLRVVRHAANPGRMADAISNTRNTRKYSSTYYLLLSLVMNYIDHSSFHLESLGDLLYTYIHNSMAGKVVALIRSLRVFLFNFSLSTDGRFDNSTLLGLFISSFSDLCRSSATNYT